ncbi:MAG TPA: efflux transporter outer membrane subunit, partial [Steroidobacteraceae bacterium]|nr:efflux transporter outer membrane subunit [Steroidobacteraceae bacterium]
MTTSLKGVPQALLGAALAALAACAAGPDFHRPAAPAGTYAMTASASRAAAAEAPSLRYGAPIAADWYRLLGSAALDRWVKLALQNNPDLQSARASVSEARARLRAAAGGEYPNLQGRALVNRAHFNPGALGLGTQGSAGGNLFAGLLQLSYHIDLFGGLRRDLEARRAAVQYARDQALNTYIGLVNQVVTTAFDLAAAQSSIDATEKLLDAERSRLRLNRLRETVGTVARAETLTAKAQLQGTEATLPGLRQRREAAAAALAALLGETPSQFQAPALRLADFKIPATLPVSLPARLVRQRPDVLAAEQRLHEASADIGIAAAARLPSFSLSADYGSLSDRGADFFNAGNALWALGGNI